MTNNDVLRRLRYTFSLSDDRMIEIFAAADVEVTRAQVSDWLKKDDHSEFLVCEDEALATFLNGFINTKRGRKDGPSPAPETHLTNNIILRKLRIALNLQDRDMHEIMALAAMPLSKPELSALFRRADHKHYRECKDQILRRFVYGLQCKFRPGASASSGENFAEEPGSELPT